MAAYAIALRFTTAGFSTSLCNERMYAILEFQALAAIFLWKSVYSRCSFIYDNNIFYKGFI